MHLEKAESLLKVGDAQEVLKVGNKTAGGLVEGLVDRRDSEAVLKSGNGGTDGLDGAGLGALVDEVEQVLGEGNTESILELVGNDRKYIVTRRVVLGSGVLLTPVRELPRRSSSLASSSVTPRPSSMSDTIPPISVSRDRCSTPGDPRVSSLRVGGRKGPERTRRGAERSAGKGSGEEGDGETHLG